MVQVLHIFKFSQLYDTEGIIRVHVVIILYKY